jgi:hypothetical protein
MGEKKLASALNLLHSDDRPDMPHALKTKQVP